MFSLTHVCRYGVPRGTHRGPGKGAYGPRWWTRSNHNLLVSIPTIHFPCHKYTHSQYLHSQIHTHTHTLNQIPTTYTSYIYHIRICIFKKNMYICIGIHVNLHSIDILKKSLPLLCLSAIDDEEDVTHHSDIYKSKYINISIYIID